MRNWAVAGRLRAKRHPVNGYRMLLKADIDALARDIQTMPAVLKNPFSGKPGHS